jgi:hypothetical protein
MNKYCLNRHYDCPVAINHGTVLHHDKGPWVRQMPPVQSYYLVPFLITKWCTSERLTTFWGAMIRALRLTKNAGRRIGHLIIASIVMPTVSTRIGRLPPRVLPSNIHTTAAVIVPYAIPPGSVT